MEWIIVFVTSWLLFFLLVDWKELKINIWAGLLAVALQMSIDTRAIGRGWYEIESKILSIFGSSLFFVLGPVLVIGTLMAQYHPQKRWLRIANVIIISILYSVFELFVLWREAVVYKEWSHIDSIIVNTSIMAVLSWFIIVVLDKKGA